MIYEVIHKLELFKSKYINEMNKEQIDELDTITDILYHIIQYQKL